MNLSFALGAERHPPVGAEAAAQRVLDAPAFGRMSHSLLETRASDRRPATAHSVFHVPHRKPEVYRLLGERRRDTRVLEREQRAGVADRETAFMQQREHRRRQFQQAEGVGDRGAVATHRVRDVLLRQAEFREETLVAARLVHGREVVTLQVLDQREREGGAVVDFALHRGDLLPAQRLASPQSALAGDQLEAAGAARDGAHHDGLQQTGLAPGALELLQRLGGDVPARLVGVGADVGDRQLYETPLALCFLARRPQQGFEPPAEPTATCDGFRHAGTSGSGSAADGAGEDTAPCSTRRVSSWATPREHFAPTDCTSYNRI